MQDIVLSALFIIKHKLNCNAGTTGPSGMGYIWPIAHQVSGVSFSVGNWLGV